MVEKKGVEKSSSRWPQTQRFAAWTPDGCKQMAKRNVVIECIPGLCSIMYQYYYMNLLFSKKPVWWKSILKSLLWTSMNYVKCISNVLVWPQGHERVCACGTQGQLSPWDHMVWLKAVPESYVREWVCMCATVRVCMCVCFIPTLISSCHLNHTHINSVTTSSHIILNLCFSLTVAPNSSSRADSLITHSANIYGNMEVCVLYPAHYPQQHTQTVFQSFPHS